VHICVLTEGLCCACANLFVVCNTKEVCPISCITLHLFRESSDPLHATVAAMKAWGVAGMPHLCCCGL